MERAWQTIILFLLFGVVNSQLNLALNGTASQSSRYLNHNANLAIIGQPTHDWDTMSCSATAENKRVAWWMLTFSTELVFISNVVIYYRSNTPERLAGFGLYITNTSIPKSAANPPTDGLCYQHTGSKLPDILQNITCDQFGKHIIIYNERKDDETYPEVYSKIALLEFCDVQIIGCYKSWWGGGCRKPCPKYCVDHHCHPNNGTCIWGCINCLQNDCYNDRLCAAGCKKGQGGLFCNDKNVAINTDWVISDIPNQEASRVTDGDKRETSCVILSGSDSRLQVDTGSLHVIKTINVILKEGLSNYGYSIYITNTGGDRLEALSLTKNHSTTYTFPFQVHERNLDRLIVGRYVILSKTVSSMEICEIEIIGCLFDFYGKLCDKECPKHCDGPCDLDNGICSLGCQDGFIGYHCNEACTPPHFGRLCTDTCKCINQPCNFVNGTCPYGGCQEGWEGYSCSKKCEKGKFGKNCAQSCDGCLMTECIADTGVCKDLSGCKPGWKNESDMCKIKCNDGYFGDCSTQCKCRKGICEKSTGVCPGNECERGWMGNTCSQECPPGTYGYNCANKCDGCVNNTCDAYKGNCEYGCKLGYIGVQCQRQVKQGDSPQMSSLTAAGIGGGVGGTLVVVIIAITVFFFRRRFTKTDKRYRHRKDSTIRKKVDTNAHSRKEQSPNISDSNQYVNIRSLDTDGSQMSLNGNKETSFTNCKDPVYINHDTVLHENIKDDAHINCHNKTNKDSVHDLHKIIQEKQIDNGFEADFQKLPKGLFQPHVEGSKEENKSKNRFLTIWPYDHSRVILRGSGTSDYINASYIDSYTKKRAYIATQGPKQGTTKDFWHMIWQENVEVIVMVTKLEENGKKKCYQYWPKSCTDLQNVGQYKLTLTEERENTVYVYRKINVFCKNEKKERKIDHFHYLKWEDHDVPDTIKLINFYKKVKRENSTSDGPMVVHCSAGIGRTGTFIAIDALYENGLETGFIDVLEFVQMMRKDRMNMIQTQEQYATVYQALLEAFTVPDSAVGLKEFCSCHDKFNSDNIPQNQRKIPEEFRKLQDIKPSYTKDDFSAALLDDNISKNVNQHILAHERYRPYLISHGKSSTNYINAVIIPSIVQHQNIIVTQFPLQNTVIDFWTLIHDTDCSTVVILENMKDNNKLLPKDDELLHFEKIEVTKTGSESADLHVTIKRKENNNTKQVNILTVNDWPEDSSLPTSEKCLLDLQTSVSNQTECRPIIVVCRDGCTRSGIFIALYLTIQKMQIENDVDLFHVVRLMQIRRPEFFSHPEEYEYCYICIRQYLEMNSLYANI